MHPDLSTQPNTDPDPHSEYGSGPEILKTKGKKCTFTNQRSTLRKLTVQCSYIIGSQRLNTPADKDNCFNCFSFTNNERRNADGKGITDGCCLVECSHTAPKKDKHNLY